MTQSEPLVSFALDGRKFMSRKTRTRLLIAAGGLGVVSLLLLLTPGGGLGALLALVAAYALLGVNAETIPVKTLSSR